MPTRVALAMAIALALCSPASVAAAAPARAPDLELSYRGGALFGVVRGVSLSVAMADVAALTGVRVHWLVSIGQEPVSVRLSGLRLPDALRLLLRGRNHVISESRDGPLSSIGVWIGSATGHGDGSASPPLGADPADPRRATTGSRVARSELGARTIARLSEEIEADPDPLVLAALIEETPEVAAESIALLADQTFSNGAPLDALVSLARQSYDPDIRSLAKAAIEGFVAEVQAADQTEPELGPEPTL